MKKQILFIILIFVLCTSGVTIAAPLAPEMCFSATGLSISVNWTSVPNATGYTLYYAPYPYEGEITIRNIDMGAETSVAYHLWNNANYHIAVTSRDDSGESPYSNIELFHLTSTSLSESLIPCQNATLEGTWGNGVTNMALMADGTYLVDTNNDGVAEAWGSYDATESQLELTDEGGTSACFDVATQGFIVGSYAYTINQEAMTLTLIDDDCSGRAASMVTQWDQDDSPSSSITNPSNGKTNSAHIDNDGDGFSESYGDCNDSNSSIGPSATEICDDRIDQNCNDQVDEDCQINSSPYGTGYQMLRHDYWPYFSQPYVYRGYVQMTKEGAPVPAEDFLGITVMNSSGTSLPLSWTSTMESYSNLIVDCTSGTCTWGSPYVETGVSVNIDALPLDDYTFTMNMSEGQVSTVIPYTEDITIPAIDEEAMQANWQEGNLVLSWENPIHEPGWSQVNQLRISVYGSGPGMSIKVPPTRNSLILPSSLIQYMASLGSESLEAWRITTRVYTNDTANAQIARGWGLAVPLPMLVSGGYVDNGNGTLTDSATGLIWQQSDDDVVRNWNEAIAYCNDLTLGANSSWRLPNVEELESLVTDSAYPKIDPVFLGVLDNAYEDNYFWTSMSDTSNPDHAWAVSATYGDTYSGFGLSKLDNWYVRCVR